jgi:hypothetical protein
LNHMNENRLFSTLFMKLKITKKAHPFLDSDSILPK